MPDFGPLWANAADGVIEYQHRQLRGAHRLAVAPGDRLHIRFERYVARPVQGLGIKLEDARGGFGDRRNARPPIRSLDRYRAARRGVPRDQVKARRRPVLGQPVAL